MYQITKQSLKDNGDIIRLVDSHSEVLEFESLHEAEDFCGILNANTHSFKYNVKRVGSTPRHKNTKETINELKTVSFYIDHASEYGLVPEVVTFALNHMKEDNRLTVAQAMSLGFQDWMK